MAGESTVTKRLPHQELRFQGSEERLDQRVIVGVAHLSHRGHDPCVAAPPSEGEARVLAAPIGVVHQPWTRPAIPQCHVQRVQHQIDAQVIGHGPAHHLPAERIQHDRQVQPPAPGPDVGDVCDPEPVRSVDGEVTRDQGRRQRCVLSSPARRISRATRFRPQRTPASRNSAWMRGAP